MKILEILVNLRASRASFSSTSARSCAKAKIIDKWCEALSSVFSLEAPFGQNSRISEFICHTMTFFKIFDQQFSVSLISSNGGFLKILLHYRVSGYVSESLGQLTYSKNRSKNVVNPRCQKIHFPGFPAISGAFRASF